MNSDVLIIGGGVIGLAVARELTRRGAGHVVVLERGICGGEASNAAAGMLAPQAEANSADDFFQLCDASNKLYDAYAAALYEETGVDVELDTAGTIYPAFTNVDADEIDRRFEWQNRAGLAVEKLSADETRRREPFLSPDVRGSLFFPKDRQVENRKVVAALKKFAELNGIDLRENTSVERLVVENGRVTGVVANGEIMTSGAVVMAAGAWSSGLAGENGEIPEVLPVRGQMISLRPAKRVFEHVIYGPRGYLVPRADGRLLVGATVEHVGFDNKTTDSGIEDLRRAAFELAPSLANLKIAEQWSGLRPMSADRKPFIGRVDGVGNLFAATAHYRNGILLAPLTANMIASAVVSGK